MSDPMAPIRAELMAQPEAERLEYALDLLAFYLDPAPAFLEGVALMGLGLCLGEARMLHALDARRGRYVSNDSLVAARNLDKPADCWPSPAKVVSAMGNIRAALAKKSLPVTITTFAGLGYCLEAPADFRFDAPRLRPVWSAA